MTDEKKYEITVADIRGWSDDHTKMTKGISLTEEEFINIARAGLEKLGGNA